MSMKSTFHETDLGQAVIQNVTASGTEQLIFTLDPESESEIQVQIKEAIPDSGSVSNSIAVNPRVLRRLVSWLREQGVVN